MQTGAPGASDPAAVVGGDAAEEPDFDIRLKGFDNESAVIEAVRKASGLTDESAADIVSHAPTTIVCEWKSEAELMKRLLEEAGADIELKQRRKAAE